MFAFGSRKKLKQDLMRSFPMLTAENLEQIVPAKDDLHQVKVITHGGDIVQFYTVEKQPIIFSRGNKLFPTIYLLWRYPQMMPSLTTVHEVVPVLQKGADFMSAGIVSPFEDKRRYGNFNKNDSVFINISNNKAAVAVGEIALSSDDMYMSAGRGKCVKVLHIFEDELCKFGVTMSLPQLGPVFEESPPPEPAVVATGNVASYAVAAKSSDEGATETALQRLTVGEEENNGAAGKVQSESASEEDIFMYCFLKALNTSLKNVKLPLLISNFYKVHMIPCCPEGRSVDVKKTAYKKMSNFMRAMATENLIKIEESSPGVQSITEINFSHYLISGFVDPHPNDNSCVREEKTEEPKVSETYSVTAVVLPLFSEFLIK
jgi:translation initiation factor 2D